MMTLACVLLAATTAANGIAVRPNAKPIVYSPMVFGSFLEHFHTQVYGGIYDPKSPLADADGFRADVIKALKEIKTPIVRWPGGCFVSAYHWRDGVGKVRESAFDKAWCVEEPNTFGTDEYVKWCRKVGCAPYICTNAGTGSPEEMSDWVEYCNATVGKFARMRGENGHPEPYDIKYWSVGNENWGAHETGAKTVAEWGPFVAESSKMMLEVDKELKLFAAATPDEGWTAPLLQAAGPYLDYVSIHRYGEILAQKYTPSTYIASMMLTDFAERDIAAMRGILAKARKVGRVKIAYDEWNLRGWHHPGHGQFRKGFDIKARDRNDTASTYTMADAVYSACTLNSFLRNGDIVEIGCFSPAVNTTGFLFVHPKGVVRRTTFHVFRMYTNLLQPQVIPCDVTSERLVHGKRSTAAVDAVLTADEARKTFVLAAVNKDPNAPRTLRIDFASLGLPVPQAVEAEILAGDSPDAFNDIGAENRVVPVKVSLPARDGAVDLPAHAVCLLRLGR